MVTSGRPNEKPVRGFSLVALMPLVNAIDGDLGKSNPQEPIVHAQPRKFNHIGTVMSE